MNLFANVFISKKRFKVIPGALDYRVHDRLDVFRYTLASWASLNFEKVIIYCELDEDYKHHEGELYREIVRLFGSRLVFFSSSRCESLIEWRAALDRIELEFGESYFLFTCNDDHFFSDCDHLFVSQLLVDVQQLGDPYVTIIPTHWVEMLGLLSSKPLTAWNTETRLRESLRLGCAGYLINYKTPASFQFLTYKLLREWFVLNSEFEDLDLRRTDVFTKLPEMQKTFIPYKELFRHFDASVHVNIKAEIVPYGFIPDGFFESSVILHYGKAGCNDGEVLIEKGLRTHNNEVSAKDRRGTKPDLRLYIDEIPHFWKDRISTIKGDMSTLKLTNWDIVTYLFACLADDRWRLGAKLSYVLLERIQFVKFNRCLPPGYIILLKLYLLSKDFISYPRQLVSSIFHRIKSRLCRSIR